MKRRHFVAGGTGMLVGQMVTAPPATAQPAARSMIRTSRVFDYPTANSKTFIQDLVFVNDRVYCLYTDVPTHYWGVTVTTPEGTSVAHYDLPKGTYLSMGVQAQNILLHALSYDDTPGHAQQNCLVRLGANGSVQFVGSMGKSFSGKLFFAGDSSFIRIDSGVVDVWNVDNSTIQRSATSTLAPSRGIPHVDLLSANLAAVTRREGTSMTTVDIQSGAAQEHPISAPEILSAIAHYASKSDPARGNPVVIPATGSDQSGTLYALVYPSPPSAVQAVKFDAAANSSSWLSFQFPARGSGARAGDFRAPIKLLPRGADVGIVYVGGSVAWYAV